MNRSRSVQLPVRNEEGSSSNTVPNQEDQIRDYRRSSRFSYEAQRRLPNIMQIRRYKRSLESQIDPDQELQLSQRRRANIVPAEVLYDSRWSEPRHRVYQHYSEERILVVGERQQLDMRFVNETSYRALRGSGMQHIHLGMAMIRIHALHRRDAGTNVLVVLRDTRWSDDRAIIGTMEVDMGRGTQLVYIAPNMMLSIHDFYNHIQLAIQTRGYEEWNNGESNLLITRGLIGRLTNTSVTGFRYNVQNVSEYLASNGIQAVAGEPWSTTQLQGQSWVLKPAKTLKLEKPEKVVTRTKMDGSISIRFSDYRASSANEEIMWNRDDQEDLRNDEEELAAMYFAESLGRFQHDQQVIEQNRSYYAVT